MTLDLTNNHLVGVADDVIVVQIPPRVMSVRDALRFAAWLVAVAEELIQEGDPDFDDYYYAVTTGDAEFPRRVPEVSADEREAKRLEALAEAEAAVMSLSDERIDLICERSGLPEANRAGLRAAMLARRERAQALLRSEGRDE